MIHQNIKSVLAVVLSLALTWAQSPVAYGDQTSQASSEPSSGGATDTQPMTAQELHSLVAPIALYPDQLVAQILSAATFPDQVAIGSYWLQEHSNLTGKDLEKEVDTQTWDASVKALTNFPSVLANMAKNLSWTSSLGEAYHNQPADVMDAVQALRAQAKAAGNLKSGSQIKVVQESPQTIVIEPADPQVIYVPQYNPAVVYGVPYVTPGYTAGDVAAAGIIGFGTGIAVGALMSGAGWGGWGAWGCNWHGGAVVYNHAAFYGNSAWHGGYYNGYHGGYGYHGNYNSNFNGYHGNYNSNFNRNVNTNINRNVNSNLNRNANFNSSHFGNSSGWAHNDSNFGKSNAFSGHSGGFGGWDSRATSQRGWGSMHAGGFGGGRFGGGGFGGGHFGGGHFGGRR
jgi:Protein of unknown function (DUF3300)